VLNNYITHSFLGRGDRLDAVERSKLTERTDAELFEPVEDVKSTLRFY